MYHYVASLNDLTLDIEGENTGKMKNFHHLNLHHRLVKEICLTDQSTYS